MGLDEHASLGTFLMRIGVGIYFIWTGALLLLNKDLQFSFANVISRTPLTAMGNPLQIVMALYTIYILIGALLLLGLFVRAAGFVIVLLAILTMAVLNWKLTPFDAGSLAMIYLLKDVLMMSCGVSLFFTGAGQWGVDNVMVE